MVYWADFPPPKESNSLRDEYTLIKTFDSLFKKYPSNSLFGANGIDVMDTAQSQYLGDCYFIAGIVAYSQKTESFSKTFIIQEVNESGILAFNVYIRGMPFVLTIDDQIPFVSYKNKLIPAFA